jgi:hypothetical protein
MSDQQHKATIEELETEVSHAVAKMKAGVLSLVFGLFAGIGLFAMTAALLIENGPNTGLHLKLLGNYFPGYAVTWKGAMIGFFWAFIVGAAIGYMIGLLYNRIVGIHLNQR